VRSDCLFLLGVAAVSIFRNGIGTRPRITFFATTFVDTLPRIPARPPLEQWELWSPLGPIVARILGIHSVDGFVVLHLAAVLLGVGILVTQVRRRHGSIAMRAATVAFVALPVSVVVQAWLGSYDAWVFLLTTSVVVTRSRTVAVGAGFALAFANFDQGAVILTLLAVVACIRPHGSLIRYAVAAAGLLAGRLALGAWLGHHGVRSGRPDVVSHLGVRYLVSVAGRHWLLLLLSLVGAAVPLLWSVASGGRRQALAVLVVLLVSAGPMLLATDETRVFALTSWPPLLALILDEAVRSPQRIERAFRRTIALAIIMPGWFIWLGRPFLSKYHWVKLFSNR
jgi:hypothetical protein